MTDPTPVQPDVVVAPVEPVAPPAVADPPPAEPAQKGPFAGPSWEDLKARHPESADDLTRLDASHREVNKATAAERDRLAAELASAKQPTAPAAAISYLRQFAGIDEGDPFADLKVDRPARPDFKTKAKEKLTAAGEAALTDPDVLAGVVAEMVEFAYDQSFDHAIDFKTRRDRAMTEKLYRPQFEAEQERAREAAAEAVVKELQRLPGMADEAELDKVYDAMVAKGRKGAEGFRATYAEMLPDNAAWTAPPKPAASASPVAAAAPPPVVVKRPTPAEEARAHSAALMGGPSRVATRVVSPNLETGTKGRIAALAADPTFQAEISVDDGRAPWERALKAAERRGEVVRR